jgi:fused signal recognition particle receptor
MRFFSKLKDQLKRTSRVLDTGIKAITGSGRMMNDEMIEEFEDMLIEGDVGVATATRIVSSITASMRGKKVTDEDVREALVCEMINILQPVAQPLPIYNSKPQVILVVGVNGTGKTTTIGKLAHQFCADGRKVMIAAGDTFRAAAVEQLQVWGERAGAPVFSMEKHGGNPVSLVYDAIGHAVEENADILLIDTAGRLSNRKDLMDELEKIVRTIKKRLPEAPHNTLLVLDATTGLNIIQQVEIFQKIAEITGIIMTKLDGTARGGVIFALANRVGLPIHAIGVGEGIDDLRSFHPEDFARAIVSPSET